jgi:hypothetical protein
LLPRFAARGKAALKVDDRDAGSGVRRCVGDHSILWSNFPPAPNAAFAG